LRFANVNMARSGDRVIAPFAGMQMPNEINAKDYKTLKKC